jgi:4-hydroxy-tetrahydrodipicolinate synthase
MAANNMPRDWGRLLTAMLTPFNSDGSVNYSEAQRIARYLIEEQKNDGLVISGTTGESPTLSEEEKLQLLERVLDAVGERAAVLFGAGTYNTAESIELARAAEERGAHGIMLVNPYYSKPGQNGLTAHFEAVSNAVRLPVMLYNIQPRSAINLETSTLLRLAQVENIVAVKEASGNLGQIGEVCREVPASFRVYSGDDALTLPILSVGGHGVVSVAAHCIGREIKEMVEAFPINPKRAIEIHQRLIPFFKAIFSSPSPVPIKYAMSRHGFDCRSVRLPLVEMTDEERGVVDEALDLLRSPATSAAAIHVE